MFSPEIGKKIIVTVPSTTANLGPGFDCLGAELDLYRQAMVQNMSGKGGYVNVPMEALIQLQQYKNVKMGALQFFDVIGRNFTMYGDKHKAAIRSW